MTTIPAAANIAMAIAYAQQETLRASILHLASNVGAMLLAGVITLTIQRALYRRHRATQIRNLARRNEATLPAAERAHRDMRPGHGSGAGRIARKRRITPSI